MKTLVLVRHAKSSWADATVDDHDRPLNERGRRDAPVMARRLAAADPGVQRLLSSTAARARATAQAFADALQLEIEVDEQLYGAAPTTIARTVSATDADAVMIVAHDPGLSVLAGRLSEGGIEHMPTCAVATFTWTTDAWADALSGPADEWRFDAPSLA